MCKPTESTQSQSQSQTQTRTISSEPKTIRVLISGAGPAGLLCTSLLLHRNKTNHTNTTYHVTLVDGRQDYGILTKDELSKSHRSWMIGLATHGCDALRSVPQLYEHFVKGVGIEVDELNIYLGSKAITSRVEDYDGDGHDDKDKMDNFIVDRNFVTAAIARFVTETHGSSTDNNYVGMYDTSCLYVDYENKQVLTRNRNTLQEQYVPYDLLIGCDGVRSVVREAMIKRHSDFSCHVRDIFQEFKAVHVTRPTSVNANALSLLPDILPGFQGIALPETGNMVNISCGTPRNLFDTMKEDHPLKSTDVKIVAKYIKTHFKAFELDDYEDFATQWIQQRWNQTGMVNCNFYHSSETNIVLMGDAAHATSPSIGMGMNTALRDAQVFYELLVQNQDDLNTVLPSYSAERVKEGNSLSNLAYYLYCADKTTQTLETVHLIVRSALHKFFPRFVSEHPQSMIGRRGIALSDVYNHATKLNVIPKHRRINDSIRNEHFEISTGMVHKTSTSCGFGSKIVLASLVVALVGVVYSAYF